MFKASGGSGFGALQLYAPGLQGFWGVLEVFILVFLDALFLAYRAFRACKGLQGPLGLAEL